MPLSAATAIDDRYTTDVNGDEISTRNAVFELIGVLFGPMMTMNRLNSLRIYSDVG